MLTDLAFRHFLFAAALVILSNEFASLHKYPTYSSHISQAISIMRYCAETDPQATRLIYILSTFQDVVSKVSPQSSEDRLEATTRTGATAASILDSTGVFFLDQPSSRSSTLQSHKTQTSRENSLTSADPTTRRSYTSATVSPTTTTAIPQSFPSVPSSVVHSQDRDEQVVEAEFEFDALWQGWNMQGGGHGPGLGVSMNHQVPPIVSTHGHDHRGSYGGYSVPPTPHSQPSGALNASVPLYSLSNFH